MNNLAAARKTITQLQEVLESAPALTSDMSQFTDHFFAPGIYLRSLFIPKGHVLVGAIHKQATINILLKGKISVVTDQGETIVAEAPFIFKAKPGQKAGYAIEDVWYVSVFPNIDNITDLDKLKKDHIVPSFDELEVLS